MHGPTLANIEDKLKEIYGDLAHNITNIYDRQDLHLIIDLVYHSPLRFKFDSHVVRKGYPEVLIVGDSRTGKTQCAEALQAHYGVGVSAGGESCSYAGLVGGLQQLTGRWTCTWGILPQNNRRLVIIDEASGLSPEHISQMSEVRSQGRARVTKIQTQETECWTRMIWLSNPREQMTVNQFSSGIDIVESLVPAPEDIARWDAILIVSKDEIEFSKMRTRKKEDVPHIYTKELSKALVLWAWTREIEEITITEEAEDACAVLGEAMSKKYCSDFMLVNPAEQNKKLARLAVALAARLYSTPDGKRLVVHENHVRYIAKFLDRIYSSRYFKYDQWSLNQTKGSKLVDESVIIQFCKEIGSEGCGRFADLRQFRCKNIAEYLGVTDDEARAKLSKLLLNNALWVSKGDYYHKSPSFQAILDKYSKREEAPAEKEF